MGKGPISNIDHVLIPSKVMKKFVHTALNVVMSNVSQQMLLDMQNAGIRLDDETAYYSLSQIRDYFHLVLGANAAEVLADMLRNTLERSGQFEKYG